MDVVAEVYEQRDFRCKLAIHVLDCSRAYLEVKIAAKERLYCIITINIYVLAVHANKETVYTSLH